MCNGGGQGNLCRSSVPQEMGSIDHSMLTIFTAIGHWGGVCTVFFSVNDGKNEATVLSLYPCFLFDTLLRSALLLDGMVVFLLMIMLLPFLRSRAYP
jgi:hypothetical protein